MPDQEHRTPDRPDEGLFRELYLGHLPPDAAHGARLFGTLVTLAVFESPYAHHGYRRCFTGIAADLDACVRWLDAYGDDNHLEGLDDPVKQWSRALARVAGEIRDSLEAASPAPAGE